MILNTDKLWLVKVIFFICKFDFSISSISSTNTGKQMERGNIIEDLTFKLCQLRKTYQQLYIEMVKFVPSLMKE